VSLGPLRTWIPASIGDVEIFGSRSNVSLDGIALTLWDAGDDRSGDDGNCGRRGVRREIARV
jgi:hypothetical protein